MTQQATLMTIADLEKLRDEMRREAEALAERAKLGAEAARHVEETITLLSRTAPTRIHPHRSYSGMTHKQAIVKMAEDFGGKITVEQAREAFLASRLTKDEKNLTTQLYKLMRAVGRFERVGKGTYALKAA